MVIHFFLWREIMTFKTVDYEIDTTELYKGRNCVNITNHDGEVSCQIVSAFRLVSPGILPKAIGQEDKDPELLIGRVLQLAYEKDGEAILIFEDVDFRGNEHLMMIYTNEANDPDLFSDVHDYFKTLSKEFGYSPVGLFGTSDNSEDTLSSLRD